MFFLQLQNSIPTIRSPGPSLRSGKWLHCVFAILVALLTTAHHSHSNLDKNNIQIHRGTVTKFDWGMPHVFIKAEAPNAAGEVVVYSIEMLHPPGMIQRGWSKTSLKPGDQITWQGPADKNPSRNFSGMIWVEKSDGTRLTMNKQDQPVVRSTDMSGLWVRDLRGGPFHYYPPSGWPYTAAATRIVEQFSEDQNPQIECKNPGPPKATLLPYPISISRPGNQTIVFDYELREKSRVIYLDRDRPPGKPSSWGHSVGWFEGDVLVIETTNFVADRWGIHTGVDSSDQKHLIERFALSDDGLALEIEMVVIDPVYLSEPVKIEYYMAKIPDRELVGVPCSLENARLFLEAGLDTGK
jgi:hypothetical protein